MCGAGSAVVGAGGERDDCPPARCAAELIHCFVQAVIEAGISETLGDHTAQCGVERIGFLRKLQQSFRIIVESEQCDIGVVRHPANGAREGVSHVFERRRGGKTAHRAAGIYQQHDRPWRLKLLDQSWEGVAFHGDRGILDFKCHQDLVRGIEQRK